MDSQSLSFSAHAIQQKSSSRLEQLMQIAKSGASDAEKRRMVKNIQMQMDGENTVKLIAHIPEVKATAKPEQKGEQLNGEETTNEHGDTVVISQAAVHQYEQSASSPSSGGSSAAVQSSAPATSAE